MFKLLAVCSFCIGIVYVTLYESSKMKDHSFLFVKGDNIYESIKKDGSFGKAALFFIVEKVSVLKRKLQTGEYKIHYNESALSVFCKITNGNDVTRKLTIPEGLTTQMIVEILNNNEFLTGEIEGCPEEASLMPDTYFYKFHDTRKSIIDKMASQMQNTILQLQAKNNTGISIKDIIILASIIEKETGLDEERRIVSSVYHNRLKKKMRLQSCPTVIYAVSNGYGKINRALTKKDLFSASPFNTYRVNGMPPTPICCPGKKAIEAALNPADTNFLYFVLSEDGVHHKFSGDFAEQVKNKNNRKKAMRSKGH
ncbi:MAG: endolytic transglycosylase MltG [Holosporales bacterium]|nr:endolytic transglycosylase MltG [Holosporales bacterium]